MSIAEVARPQLHRTITVASVPAGHVYVRHLDPVEPPGPPGVRRLPDPPVPGSEDRAADQRWWPPVMLDPRWAAEADYDVFHLHFGFDARAPEDLAELVRTIQGRGKSLVYTAHDLRNPHHRDRELHDRQLDVLVPAADALVTLTTGAAAEIERRWGRTALVVPHPHVVPFARMRAAQAMREAQRRAGAPARPFRVGLHVKSLRESMDPERLLPTLVRAVGEIPGGELVVNAHNDVMAATEGRRASLARALREAAARDRITLHVHDYYSDDELWDYLCGLDVSVLPYRFGTHSGWLEACRDVGTAVIAPTCGYYADQAPVLTYAHTEDDFDPASLEEAVHQAHRGRPATPVGPVARRRQREGIAAAHLALYADLVDAPSPSAS